jgi:hypothetical protein
MKNSEVAGHRAHRKHALATTGCSHRQAKRHKIYCSLRETASKSTAIVQMQPKLRITPPMQAEILRLYVQGCSLCEIARRTGRARQTCTKVVRAPDIQAKIQEQKEKLLGESDAWLESVNFAVAHELNGQLAFRLSQLFEIIPFPSKKAAPVKPQDDWEGVDAETLLKAKVLGQVAMERGSAMQVENEGLEKLVQKEKVQPNRKSPRLFDEALGDLPEGTVIDGEIWMNRGGQTSTCSRAFEAQRRQGLSERAQGACRGSLKELCS